MSAHQRNKGAAFERRIAKDLRVAGYKAKRNLNQYQEKSGRDITVDAPFCFQLKCGLQPNWKQALREAVESCGSDYAVAITKGDRSDPVVHMPWWDFLDMISLPDVRPTLKGAK